MAKPYQHLTLSNRILIEHERCKGSSCQDLAQMLQVHRTTIARELRRNSLPNGRYDHQLAQLRAQRRRTVASSQPRPKTARFWDEFAAHAYAAKFLNAQFYFCKPYHSWQRGQIEHLNGLVRRTFRKQQSFHHLTREAVALEEQQLNQMPRKCLGFRTPKEVFDTLLAQAPPKT